MSVYHNYRNTLKNISVYVLIDQTTRDIIGKVVFSNSNNTTT